MIKSSPFSFIRFEHPADSDETLDIPYTLAAYQNHEVAFQFGLTVDKPSGDPIEIGVGNADGTFFALIGPTITGTPVTFPVSLRYLVTNLLSYTTFYFKQITIDGVTTIFNETVTYAVFQQMLFDLGLTLEGEYIISVPSISVTILADTTNVSGIPTDFDGAALTEYWHQGFASVNEIAIDPSTPDCFTYVLLLPDNSVMGYSNIFRQISDNKFTSLVTYSCNESQFDFIYGAANIVRLPFYLLKPQFPKKREVYRKSNGTQKLLNSLVEKEYTLETEQMPEVFHECMAIMLGHDNVTIVNSNIRETSVTVIEADTYNPLWEGEGIMLAKGAAKLKVATFSYSNSNCS